MLQSRSAVKSLVRPKSINNTTQGLRTSKNSGKLAGQPGREVVGLKHSKHVLKSLSSINRFSLSKSSFIPPSLFTSTSPFIQRLNYSTKITTMDKPGVKYPNHMRFDCTPQEIKDLAVKIIEDSKAALDKVAATVSNPTWESTIVAYIDEDAEYCLQHSNCSFLSHVSTDKAIRDASNDATKDLDAYSIEKSQRLDVYHAVKAYVEQKSKTDNLNKEQKYALDKIMNDFVLSGMSLPDEKRSQLKDIRQEISRLCIEFSKNVTEDATKLEFTKEQLDGTSDAYLEGLTKNGDKYVVSLQYPDIIPVLKKAKNPETRKAMNIAKASQCMEANVPIFEKVVELRQKAAALLGFASPAHLVLSNKMAKNPENVMNFLEDLSSKLDKGLDDEMAVFLKLKEEECKALGLPFDGVIHSWDRLYYDNLVLMRDYNIDDEAIAEYFPMGHVVETTLEIYQNLFGLKFSLTPDPHVWHPDVKQYSVHDADTNDFIGHFYLDLHPREGKYGHAAEFGLQKSCVNNGKRQYPAAAMVANFSKPTAETPSLLKHDEVTTWAHELGHVLHELLGTSTYSAWSGTSVQRDFVEAPSQALENWCYEKECLLKLSKHHKTGAPLPDNLIEALARSRNANIATFLRRQLFFAKFDMTVHTMTESDPKLDSGKLWHDLSVSLMKVAPPENTNGVASFGHLVGGYDSGYYGYLWSEVFAADIFRHFKKNGILNGKIGREYRRKVLAPGGSCDAMELLVDFLGREPNNDAFLEQIGLKK